MRLSKSYINKLIRMIGLGLAATTLTVVFILPARSAAYTITLTGTIVDGQGRSSQAYAGLTVLDLPPAITLSEAKSYPDGSVVRVNNLVASSSSMHFNGLFYAQRPDRTGGIGIIWDGPIDCGERIWVLGGITTLSGERFIRADVVETEP